MTTPMMLQYKKIKAKNPDAILFFRLGDFYEMFDEDAKIASRLLEITLTTRDAKKESPMPMCGIPYHAVNSYLGKLLSKGYKVAICEQVEDPVQTKGIVKREVVRVITPGTVIDRELLSEKNNNYLAALHCIDNSWGLALVDVSTGEFIVTELPTDSDHKIVDEINRFEVKECLLSNNNLKSLLEGDCILTEYPSTPISTAKANTTLERVFGKPNLDTFGIAGCNAAVGASAILIRYLEETQKQSLAHINNIRSYSSTDYMLLDGATRRNLELLETMRSKERRGSLLWVMDRTVTAMGGRLLKKIIHQPLLQAKEIKLRQNSVSELVNNVFIMEELKEQLKDVYDIERLMSKIVFQSANGRDLLALGQSLEKLPYLKATLGKMNSLLIKQSLSKLDTLEDVSKIINRAIKDNPPVSITDGGVIKEGYNEEVDQLKEAALSGKHWLAKLEQSEKEQTGIRSLKVRYNKVFGYYIEITKANLNLVPEYYQRKQTLVNSERFITPRLKELENTILGAEEKQMQLEYECFCQIRDSIKNETKRIQQTSQIIAIIDVLLSFSIIAKENNYVCPKIVGSDDKLVINDGRHPVLEKLADIGEFVANDVTLGGDTELMIITGPNMAGKSTFMRQVALIVLMAQIGSFVPAKRAEICLIDRIFTRVGAADDLSTGQSTFMVEMNEVANILHNATGNSLIILDEIGRGTSTYDGMAIAWSVIEYITLYKRGAKTLFATHYHNLTNLEHLYPEIRNCQVAVEENGEDIVFLRKIIPGGTDRSYGIQVAKLAGLPRQVVKRAQQILHDLECETQSSYEEIAASEPEEHYHNQMLITISEELLELDISNTTPLEALNFLNKLQKTLREETS